MGRLYGLIQDHIDAQPYGVSARQIAAKLDVSPTTLANWREPTLLIEKAHLEAIARLTGVPYQRVLDALLEDIGYLHPGPTRQGEPDAATVTELSPPSSKVTKTERRVANKPKRPAKRRGDDDLE